MVVKDNDRFNKYISVVVIAAFIFAIGLITYIYLVEKEPSDSDQDTVVPLLTISVGTELYNYSLNELMVFDSVSGQGGYINKIGKITGPNNYTGVSVGVLLNSIGSMLDNYTLHAVANDGYSLNYSLNEVKGQLSVYNKTGVEIGVGNLTMIIAYKENGELINETSDGPLRIVFVDEQGSITRSEMWLKSLVGLEIVQLLIL